MAGFYIYKHMNKYLSMLLLGALSLSAQGINAEIKLDVKNLNDVPRQAISHLATDIAYYIESTEWTFEDLPTDFTIQATIYLDSYIESGSQKIYTGKAFWGNGDDQKYFDKSWQFTFNPGDALLRSRSFNTLTSFLDYWVLTILGGDLDTWSQFGGSQLYTEARQVARNGSNDSFSLGWKDRLEDIEKLSRSQNFRKMKFAYYESIDQWDSGNKDEARATLAELMRNLESSIKMQESRILTKNFLNAKHKELAAFLYEVGEVSYLQRLSKADEDHRDHYDQILIDW
ncbi:MAG: DUF4835 family protein [Candidatus Marinimicrobia bacterium]|nr:DUF4835 family protein [Candidatus Neomarinimicrobiota bacterium]